jgi:hypothetical protein
VILLLGEKRQPLLGLVEKVALAKGLSILWLEPHALVNHLAIKDVISQDGQISIRWQCDDFEITPQSVSGIVNYLNFFGDSIMETFQENDRDYVLREINSYFAFAINQFSNVVNRPTVGSISGFSQSLPWQWELGRRLNVENILAPSAYYGSMYRVPPKLRISPNTVISKSLYEPRLWLRTCGWPPITENVFCYERPEGEVLIATIFDDHLWLDGECSQKAVPRLKTFCTQMMESFNLRLGQFLFFNDQTSDNFTFGSLASNIDLAHVDKNELANALLGAFAAESTSSAHRREVAVR